MRERKRRITIQLSFNSDFEGTFNKYVKIISHNKEITETVPEKQKKKLQKCGYFNYSIKKHIEEYVGELWEPFCQSKGININKPKPKELQ